MPDAYNLQRFTDAQHHVYRQVLRELQGGEKNSHWMWFVFPQIEGLGSSPKAMHYAIASPEEASAYAAHPILGARLRECTRTVLGIRNRGISEIFGAPDDVKFRSCMTLFAQIAPEEPLFREALDRYFGGESDPLTLAILARKTP